jgi:glycosyltransferase involved in cell wall biosynthesis
MTVQHEGIATDELGPDPNATLAMPSGKVLKAGDPVVTFVARNLEPYRGFHVFMRALERIQKEHPTCHAVIVGGDDVSYGKRPTAAPSWREKMLREVKLDPLRTHFLGRVPRATYVRVLQVSAVHVYLTYPFVLSWSLLEALQCAAQVIASDTAPVREALQESAGATLVGFHDLKAACRSVLQALEGASPSENCRRIAAAFSRGEALARYTTLLVPPSSSEQRGCRSVSQVRGQAGLTPVEMT